MRRVLPRWSVQRNHDRRRRSRSCSPRGRHAHAPAPCARTRAHRSPSRAMQIKRSRALRHHQTFRRAPEVQFLGETRKASICVSVIPAPQVHISAPHGMSPRGGRRQSRASHCGARKRESWTAVCHPRAARLSLIPCGAEIWTWGAGDDADADGAFLVLTEERTSGARLNV